MKNLKSLLILIAMTRCAQAQPHLVYIDHKIKMDTKYPSSQPTCNREAFEIIYERKNKTELEHKLERIDLQEKIDLSNAKLEAAEAALNRSDWWSRNGTSVAITGAIATCVALIGGFFIGHFIK